LGVAASGNANCIGSQTANYVYAAPNGSSGAPTFRALAGSDLPTIAISGGGTGQTTAATAFNALSPLTTEGDLHYYHSSSNTRLAIGGANTFLTSNGTDPSWGSLTGAGFGSQTANYIFATPNGSSGNPSFRAMVAADVPTLNQSTTGNAATATALASTPTQCTGSNYATGIAANGNANCSTPSSSGTFGQLSASTGNVSSTQIVSSVPSTPGFYTLKWVISLTAAGTSCTGNTSVQLFDVFTDPNTSATITNVIGTPYIASNGVGTVGYVSNGVESILAKNATSISIGTQNYTTGCTGTNPTYQVSYVIYQEH
jgi:hypothetical protein